MIKENYIFNEKKITIKDLKPSDKHALLRFYKNLSNKSKISLFEGYRSFHSWRTKKVGNSVLYTDGMDIDFKNSWSIIAIMKTQKLKEIIGDIRAYRNKIDNSVEISLVVHEDFRGLGLGKLLLDSMIKKLTKLEFNKIYCFIDKENEIMIHLIEKFAFIKERNDENLYYLNLL